VTKLEFRLTPANCKIHGTVRDTAGRPLAAEVFLLKSGVVVQEMMTTAESGDFEFPALAGRYELTLTAAGYSSKGWTGDLKADTKVDFNLQKATNIQPRPRGRYPGK
jgi:hypothetical protein